MNQEDSKEAARPLAVVAIGGHGVDPSPLLWSPFLQPITSGASIALMPPPPAPESVARLIDALDRSRTDSGTRRLERRRPATGISAAFGATGRWVGLPTGAGAERFGEAQLPAWLAGARVLTAGALDGSFATSPCGLLVSFVHPRQRIALRASGDRGAAAELAAVVDPTACCLAGEWHGSAIAISTKTLLAGQLLWWAFRPDRPSDERFGAWEQPEVQRLAGLDLHPRRPEEFTIEIRGGSSASPAEAVAELLVDRLGPVAVTVAGD